MSHGQQCWAGSSGYAFTNDRLRGVAPKKGALNGDLFHFRRGSLPWLGGGLNFRVIFRALDLQ